MIEIGQSVKVKRLRDRLPADKLEVIKKNPTGTVTDFRMVDGSGVGVVVELTNGFATWFFEDEIEAV